MIDKELFYIALILFVVLTFITAYVIYNSSTCKYKVNYCDFLNIKLLGTEWLTLWGITHFTLYGLLTFLFPSRAYMLLCTGVMWEFLEDIFGYLEQNDMLFGFNRMKAPDPDGDDKKKYKYTGTWWTRNEHDFYFNTFGSMSGYFIRKVFDSMV